LTSKYHVMACSHSMLALKGRNTKRLQITWPFASKTRHRRPSRLMRLSPAAALWEYSENSYKNWIWKLMPILQTNLTIEEVDPFYETLSKII